MKLRTRLIIAFFVIILVPAVLLVLAVFGFSRYQMRLLEETYEVDVDWKNFSDGMRLIGQSTQSTFEALQLQAADNPERFLDTEYLKNINNMLSDRYSWLLVRVDEELYFNGSGEEDAAIADLLSALPMYRSFRSAVDGGSYIGGDIQAFVKQFDVEQADGRHESIFFISSVSRFMGHARRLLGELVASAAVILLLTATLLTLWIYAGINNPLKRLSDATHRIRNNDFDFEIKAEGNDEISDLFRDFDEMRSRLKEQAEKKDEYDRQSKELISNISHDLKTPITSIKGYVEGLMDGVADTPEKMERYIRTIYVKANDMDRLINELTFYSKIDTNRIPYNFNRINVSEYFDDCAEDVGIDLRESGIEFSYINNVADDTEIIAEAEQLTRVINNIISNSGKYTDKPQKTVQLRVSDAGDFVRVEIEDNGKGIPVNELTNIFERFYRTDVSRNAPQGGSGIGLSIVKKIVEDHGGRIWASSHVGEGTTMTFEMRKYREPV